MWEPMKSKESVFPFFHWETMGELFLDQTVQGPRSGQEDVIDVDGGVAQGVGVLLNVSG